MCSSDTSVKGPPLFCEVGKVSSQSWVSKEDLSLTFVPKGFRDIPGRRNGRFKGLKVEVGRGMRGPGSP